MAFNFAVFPTLSFEHVRTEFSGGSDAMSKEASMISQQLFVLIERIDRLKLAEKQRLLKIYTNKKLSTNTMTDMIELFASLFGKQFAKPVLEEFLRLKKVSIGIRRTDCISP